MSDVFAVVVIGFAMRDLIEFQFLQTTTTASKKFKRKVGANHLCGGVKTFVVFGS